MAFKVTVSERDTGTFLLTGSTTTDVTPEFWKEVYMQTVEALDLQAVIAAVNGMEQPATAPVKRSHRKKEAPSV